MGTVYDPSGAVIANASVTAKNLATGVEYTTKSSATGQYRLSNLPGGVYTVTVAASGLYSVTDQRHPDFVEPDGDIEFHAIGRGNGADGGSHRGCGDDRHHHRTVTKLARNLSNGTSAANTVGGDIIPGFFNAGFTGIITAYEPWGN